MLSHAPPEKSILLQLTRIYGDTRAYDLLAFWKDHRLDPPISAQEVEEFFFQEVSL